MKILHILDHSIPLHSGYTFRSAALLAGQRALGWQTFHLTSSRQRSYLEPEEQVGELHFHRTPLPWHGLSRLPVLGQLADMRLLERRLEEVVREVRPDILHAHSPVLNAFPALAVGRRHHLPVVYEIRAFWEDAAVDHGTTREGSLRYRMTRALETRACQQADAVTCICEGLQQDLAGRGIPSSKITVIPNAVDPAQFTFGVPADTNLRTSLGLEDARVIGFIGSFYAYEGLDLLLAAAPSMIARDPRIRILLVGGGPEESRLRAQAAQLGLAQHVIFTGRVPHQIVNRYYSLVDVLVYARHPMRLTDLVTPLKPLEAMAQGQLFVASDVGGHRELIRDGQNGRLFRAGDAGALTSAVLSLLEDEEAWPGLRLRARQYVEHERTWQHSVVRYVPLYTGLLNRTSRPGVQASHA